jgi:hypothetical protein
MGWRRLEEGGEGVEQRAGPRERVWVKTFSNNKDITLRNMDLKMRQ